MQQELTSNRPRRYEYDPFEEFARQFSNAMTSNPFATALFPSQLASAPSSSTSANWPSSSSALMASPMFSSLLASSARKAVAMDVSDMGDHYQIQVELPGIPKDNISVHIDGNRLYVQATRQEQRESERGRIYICERQFGSLRRSVELPGSVNPSEVSASMENGVLSVSVGKNPEEEPGRSIPVN